MIFQHLRNTFSSCLICVCLPDVSLHTLFLVSCASLFKLFPCFMNFGFVNLNVWRELVCKFYQTNVSWVTQNSLDTWRHCVSVIIILIMLNLKNLQRWRKVGGSLYGAHVMWCLAVFCDFADFDHVIVFGAVSGMPDRTCLQALPFPDSDINGTWYLHLGSESSERWGPDKS